MRTSFWKKWMLGLAGLLFLFIAACSHQQIPKTTQKQTVFVVKDIEEKDLTRYAPAFETDGHSHSYDRIGRPSARMENSGKTEVYVDPTSPAMYYMKRTFETKKARYTNLIYRVHFSEVPFELFPFNLTAGKNVGLMVIITLDGSQRPVLITTVHTCGCYVAIIPTTYLPADCLPEDWKKGSVEVYGETLPGILDYAPFELPTLLVKLRSGVHRVSALEIVEQDHFKNENTEIEHTELIPIEELERLPLGGGMTTSFYHEKGLLKGYVKGSIKPWESIFLSLISLDLFIGTDKAYADTDETGNPFFTSLKPWNREASNIWNFETFLQFWGWRL